jgi:5-methylcytosine-specific restriction enzyme subunit McrC
VLQGYRVVDESGSTVRGRIRFDDQLRLHFGTAPPIEIRHDEFTEDIEENRLLKGALRRLSALRITHEEHRRALRVYSSALRNVSPVEYDRRRLPEVPINRLNARYEQALEIAALILKSTAIEVETGTVKSAAFTVDMNEVFEDFVVASLRQQLKLSARVFPQNAHGRRLRFDVDETIRLKPDLSWWEAGNCCFVGDVKYKRTDDAIKHPDLYQLNAYATATGLPGGLLIYAAGEALPTNHVIARTGKRLLVRILDVTGTPHEVLARVSDLAEEVRQLKTEAEVAPTMPVLA